MSDTFHTRKFLKIEQGKSRKLKIMVETKMSIGSLKDNWYIS